MKNNYKNKTCRSFFLKHIQIINILILKRISIFTKIRKHVNFETILKNYFMSTKNFSIVTFFCKFYFSFKFDFQLKKINKLFIFFFI